jgi:hypothetical protein
MSRRTPAIARGRSKRAPRATAVTLSASAFATRIEECFGWAKTVGALSESLFVGCEKLDFQRVLTMAAYILIRMRNLGGLMLMIVLSRERSARQPRYSAICMAKVKWARKNDPPFWLFSAMTTEYPQISAAR